MDNILYKKTIIWNGDSICEGSEQAGNWAERIAERNDMVLKNYAKGGGTVAPGFADYWTGEPRHCIFNTIDKMAEEYPDADYIILEGGTNDADRIANGETNLTLGDCNGEAPDLNTFCGYFEDIIIRTKFFWKDKKIGYIIPQIMGTTEKEQSRRRRYFDKAVEICKKHQIPYLDLWKKSDLDPCNPDMYNPEKTPEENHRENTGCYCDGQHLTAKGYDDTVDMVEAWICKL